MKGIGHAVSFVIGIVVGGVAVHFVEKSKFELEKQAIRDEDTKFYMKQLQEADTTESEPVDIPPIQTEAPAEESTYDELVASYDTTSDIVMEGVKEAKKLPYPISAQQFGKTGNDMVMLSYYADGVLVDEMYNVVSEDDIVDYVGGRNFVKWFGEYGELGVVHVRNDKLNIDFEIDQDPRNWRDFKKSLPSFPTGRGPLDDVD